MAQNHVAWLDGEVRVYSVTFEQSSQLVFVTLDHIPGRVFPECLESGCGGLEEVLYPAEHGNTGSVDPEFTEVEGMGRKGEEPVSLGTLEKHKALESAQDYTETFLEVV